MEARKKVEEKLHKSIRKKMRQVTENNNKRIKTKN